MSFVVPTRIHRQNADGYCGAASAQMALVALGMHPRHLEQKPLYVASHEHPWYSRPDMLTDTLNDRWRDRKNLRFRLYRCADKAGVVGEMRRTFEQFGCDGAVAIALTMSTHHWVVVRGFETHPDDPSKLIGFHVRNPMPSLEGNSEDRLHDEDDDCCAQHGVCHNCHYMSLANWNQNVHPVSQPGPWLGEFLVICPDRIVEDMCDEVMVPPTIDGQAAPPPPPPAGPILSPEVVEARVQQLIADNQFVGVDCIKDAATRTLPVTPILVEGLNDDGSIDPAGSYYLVPFIDPAGDWGDVDSVPMAMTVNAVTGEFEEVIAVPDGSIYEPDWISPEGIDRRASDNNLGTLRKRREPAPGSPHVAVWRHTEQTPTRFWPLFIADQADGDRAGDTSRVGSDAVFMRIDGQVVTELDEMHP